MKETFSLNLKRPREATFDALTDAGPLLNQAAGGEITLETVPDRPRTGLGSALRIKGAKLAGKEILIEVTEWKRPERVVRRVKADGISAVIDLTLTETPEGTSLDVSVEVTPENMMFKMMLPLFEKKIQDEKPKALARLQATLDQLPA